MDRESYRKLFKHTSSDDPQRDADSLHDAYIETGAEDLEKLRRYARYRAVDERRRIRRHTADSPTEQLKAGGRDCDPCDNAERKEYRQRVADALMLLKPEQRELAIALWWHELKPTEIACRLNVCVKTVYRRKNALCAVLRTLLDYCAPNAN
ncbi:RNA polymerase sigma factor [Maioricimonas rarisocia]|uniref:RNA polymerase sigma factor n=1 Tax=Maioricimonas rarisocia TaxID=2528026 RepID=A0A517ZAX8_9PLAN|nr:hypothetical protein [Maioricimonas rarisocia]QDU39644.1 RNA polymerase sigma factor [Maioricimonas rarisocia]